MAIARLVRPRGNRGELEAIPLSSRMERYQLLEEVFLFGPDGPLNENRPFEVQSVWEHRGRLVFKLGEVDSISEAEQLRGAEVRIPLTSRLEVAPDEYYHSDLIGCVVIESGSGARVGRVKEWREYGGAGLLEVEGTQAGEEILIPFASSICVDIDVEARRIVVKMPEGLKELNRR